jgi:hypothetical protein
MHRALPRLAVSGASAEKKNRADMKIAASGTAIRVNQIKLSGSLAASRSTWHISERMTITPAWAWPARNRFWRKGFDVYAGSVSELSKKLPPYSIVGTVTK